MCSFQVLRELLWPSLYHIWLSFDYLLFYKGKNFTLLLCCNIVMVEKCASIYIFAKL